MEVVKTVASVSVNPAASDGKPAKPVLQPAYDNDGKAVGRVINTDVLVSISQAQVADEVALEALEVASSALVEISNTNTVGWSEVTPGEKYRVLISHMSNRAREASEVVSAAIRQLKK